MNGPSVPVVLAADVGGSSIKLGYGAPSGELLGIRSIPMHVVRSDGDVVGGVVRELTTASTAPPPGTRVDRIALVVPGIVDPVRGLGRWSAMLKWRDVPFVSLVSAATGLPVLLGHDVGAGAMAEGAFGAARGHQDWLFLAIGTGLGSAFVIDGQPYRGSGGYGGELAHVVVDPGGVRCECGKQGCLETICGGAALVGRYRDLAGVGPELSAADIVRLASSGDDPCARRVWDAAVTGLAQVVAGHVESMNPDLIVVGGGLAESEELLMRPLSELLAAQVRFADLPVLRRAELRVHAGLRGAALMGRRTERAGAGL